MKDFIYTDMETTEEVNKYYDLINQYIDSYIDEWNIRPSKLKKYLNPNRVKSYLEKSGLDSVKMINRVIDDVIDDRVSMEKDNVLTFESYIMESLESEVSEIDVYSNIPNASIDHEKILADKFDTALSRISIVNPARHIFDVDGMVADNRVVVFDESEMNIIKDNMISMISNSISKSKVKVEGFPMEVEVGKFVDESKLKTYSNNLLTDEVISDVLKEMLGCSDIKSANGNFIGMNPSMGKKDATS